ncbi:TPA: hypothetical protein ACKPZC_003889 [Pseudomonas aeruginosa]|uniref:hypothetical protein n=1 Tax=Pseudomonas aeruginosa TaxID=287 RepID=UPI0012961EE3|nr:hypothetical protein [Pseudomonas aeruginosa]ELG5198624.1 hypothetical protein [Pseudomonas aeruginosa]MBH4371021.1 hypothetical protein [Pseudomonas aeruginosa]MBI7452278.1 hypothetical protein [Pseudomonas aeruginosa]MBI7482356.1 hypothetical protein [Pseudomonas aeruginosa]MBI8458942.1 hypothetical protein [Pseudomonas aeruginosa]
MSPAYRYRWQDKASERRTGSDATVQPSDKLPPHNRYTVQVREGAINAQPFGKLGAILPFFFVNAVKKTIYQQTERKHREAVRLVVIWLFEPTVLKAPNQMGVGSERIPEC